MDNTKEFVEALINGCTTLVARNKFGNVVTIISSFDIPETTLREIEKGILKNLNQRVTVFCKVKIAGVEDRWNFTAELDFDAKFPYDRYPWQNLLDNKGVNLYESDTIQLN